MSVLRRIVQNPTVSKAFIPYPLGREPSSLPKIEPNLTTIYNNRIDRRPISLRYRVTAMIEMCNLDKAARISHLAVLDKFRKDRDTVFICNSVIGAMCEAKRYVEALSLFNYFFNECETLPNTLSCNLIMKAHCDQGRVDEALELYRHIVLVDGRVSPGIETYKILTEALVVAKRLDEACALERSMRRRSFMVYDILLRGFLDTGRFVEASRIFEELKGPNSRLPWREYHKAIAVFSASFMKYWFKQGKDEEAMEIYAGLDKLVLQVDPIAGNRVLEVLVEHGKKTVALDLFEEMICDSETVDIVFKGFSETIIPFDFEWLRISCYGTMIKRLCEQGNVSEAEELFADLFSDVERDQHLMAVGPDVSTFRAMINGYVKVGRVDDAMKMLDRMKISTLRKLAIHRAT